MFFIEILFQKVIIEVKNKNVFKRGVIMYGFSIFLHEEISTETLSYMEEMVEIGFRGIFSSIHIPEDDDSKYMSRLQKVGSFAKQHQLEFVVDISGSALEKIGISIDDLAPLREMGLTGIRIDYGISMASVAKISQQMDVALNASTISESDFAALKEYDADFNRMEAWHNYYPRPETGLDEGYFLEKNRWLKEAGFRVMAFIPGDEGKRGPIFAGLPTLEKHRDLHPLGSAIELEQQYLVDKIYVGDPKISAAIREQFACYIDDNTILFHAISLMEGLDYFAESVGGKHTNRLDAPRDVVRSAESRERKADSIAVGNTLIRSVGSITMDNDSYGRYAGEVQITKRNLPEDERVNVLGRIDESELSLLEYCGPGQKFEIRWEERE